MGQTVDFYSIQMCLWLKEGNKKAIMWWHELELSTKPLLNQGADQQMLFKQYRSLVHSKLDHAIFIYKSARRSYFKQLDPIYHEGLRKVLGAFRTSPVHSLYAEAHEKPLQLRCEKTGSPILHKTQILPIQPNLWLHLQL